MVEKNWVSLYIRGIFWIENGTRWQNFLIFGFVYIFLLGYPPLSIIPKIQIGQLLCSHLPVVLAFFWYPYILANLSSWNSESRLIWVDIYIFQSYILFYTVIDLNFNIILTQIYKILYI